MQGRCWELSHGAAYVITNHLRIAINRQLINWSSDPSHLAEMSVKRVGSLRYCPGFRMYPKKGSDVHAICELASFNWILLSAQRWMILESFTAISAMSVAPMRKLSWSASAQGLKSAKTLCACVMSSAEPHVIPSGRGHACHPTWLNQSGWVETRGAYEWSFGSSDKCLEQTSSHVGWACWFQGTRINVLRTACGIITCKSDHSDWGRQILKDTYKPLKKILIYNEWRGCPNFTFAPGAIGFRAWRYSWYRIFRPCTLCYT